MVSFNTCFVFAWLLTNFWLWENLHLSLHLQYPVFKNLHFSFSVLYIFTVLLIIPSFYKHSFADLSLWWSKAAIKHSYLRLGLLGSCSLLIKKIHWGIFFIKNPTYSRYWLLQLLLIRELCQKKSKQNILVWFGTPPSFKGSRWGRFGTERGDYPRVQSGIPPRFLGSTRGQFMSPIWPPPCF